MYNKNSSGKISGISEDKQEHNTNTQENRRKLRKGIRKNEKWYQRNKKGP